MTPKLTIDMIPSTSWWDNARSRLPKGEWDRLRRAQYRVAGYKCEICGQSGLDQGARWPVECHEVWEYRLDGVQKLVRLIALCPRCHHVKHFGRTEVIGGWQLESAFRHLMAVNAWSAEDAKAHVQVAYEIWASRSSRDWEIDISFLTGGKA